MLLPLRPGRLSWLEERLLFFKQAARPAAQREELNPAFVVILSREKSIFARQLKLRQ
jgi:hypothetical protein